MPTIDIDGVGRIAFPILPVQAERLVAIAEAAPYGRGEERWSIAKSGELGRSNSTKDLFRNYRCERRLAV